MSLFKWLLSPPKDMTQFHNQGMRVGRRGRIRGASYEQATGQEPPARVRQFGQTWDPSHRGRRRR